MSLARALMPVLRLFDPEAAHNLAIGVLERGLLPGAPPPPASLSRDVFGLRFPGPVGLAAGFDKDARAVRALFRVGFGFVEVGTVTPKPQPGNPTPRLFRLSKDKAVINRMGFNNQGHDAMRGRLEALRDAGPLPGPLGVNLGKNKDQDDPVADYVLGVQVFAPLADYLVINISSPNTPGLRGLQEKEPLNRLLGAVMETREVGAHQPPVCVKIAPDLDPESLDDIADVVSRFGVEGVIATNTTISRPVTLADPRKTEGGGLSGAPLLHMSTEILKGLSDRLDGKAVLIGVGGVRGPEDVKAKLDAGASLVQLYSALVYEGPDLASRLHRALAADVT